MREKEYQLRLLELEEAKRKREADEKRAAAAEERAAAAEKRAASTLELLVGLVGKKTKHDEA